MADDIWLVTAGSYSDYYVVAAFSTREAADAFAADWRFNAREDANVERCDLDPPIPVREPVDHAPRRRTASAITAAVKDLRHG